MPKVALQSDKYDFEVIQKPWIEDGQKTGVFGNFRTDTGACLGTTSDQYGIVQNADLVKAARETLDAKGLTDWKEKIIVTGKGERMFAEFTFANKQLAMSVGDLFGYKLVLKNSFDRSLRAAFSLAFLRLTCLNGASTLEKEFGVTRKHSSKISMDFIGKAIDSAFNRGQDALRIYDQLAKVNIDDEQGKNILAHLVQSKVLSGSLSEEITTLWLAPKRDEDKARNLWTLYNAVTEHLTHGVEGERYEYASKINTSVLFRLVNASRKPDVLAKLIIPMPKQDEATVTVDAQVVGEAADATVVEAEIVQ